MNISTHRLVNGFLLSILFVAVQCPEMSGQGRKLSDLDHLTNNASIQQVVPASNGCLWVFGELSPVDDNFAINSCGSSFHIRNIGKIGYFQQIQRVRNNIFWAIIDGTLVEIELSEGDLQLSRTLEATHTFLAGLFFIDTMRGWACGRDGKILATLDGGRNWNLQTTKTDIHLRQIRFSDNKFGWAIGEENRDGDFLSIFLTTENGGRTWQQQVLPSGGSLTSASFVTGFTGCGLLDTKTVYCTRGGRRWKSVSIENQNLSDIIFVSRDVGYVVGDTISKTINGGKVWRSVLEDSQNRQFSSLDGVIFSSPKLGYVWDPHTVLATKNGGKTWENISRHWFERR
ncbi:MAG: WD40/YVTN/BNR-like repeat-containing protein [Pyrinomonadaceae bacterium]